VNGKNIGTASGRRKKEAETQAAKKALAIISEELSGS
jgi:dsRNA-specific ribonuclease